MGVPEDLPIGLVGQRQGPEIEDMNLKVGNDLRERVYAWKQEPQASEKGLREGPMIEGRALMGPNSMCENFKGKGTSSRNLSLDLKLNFEAIFIF